MKERGLCNYIQSVAGAIVYPSHSLSSASRQKALKKVSLYDSMQASAAVWREQTMILDINQQLFPFERGMRNRKAHQLCSERLDFHILCDMSFGDRSSPRGLLSQEGNARVPKCPGGCPSTWKRSPVIRKKIRFLMQVFHFTRRSNRL